MKQIFLLFGLGLLGLSGCQPSQSAPALPTPEPIPQAFADYWFQGTAELTSFRLEQVRYGEPREGLATTIYVKEDFSRSRYVKLDYPEQAGDDAVPVLKFNLNKRFTTGIYDYTLMQSSFTPIQRQTYPNSLRVTTSNIEWCGAFLTNTRLTEEGYRVDYQSYFDGEEDLSLTLPKVWLEDEIWNVIRINPELLPLGTVRMVPSILTEELTHHPLALAEATATLEQHDNLSVYTLDYPTLPRLLAITFESAFPHRLVRWEETFETVAGWGMEPQVMTTRAERIRYTMLDYWERKYLKDEVLRMTELGIE